MKKLTYLFSIFTLILITSCDKKDEPKIDGPIDEGLITLAELDGKWYFQHFIYDGVEYDREYHLPPDGIHYMFIDMWFDTNEMKLTEGLRGKFDDYPFSYEKEVNCINVLIPFDQYRCKFTVVNFDGTQLHLRVDYTAFTYNYLGGIIVLKK